MAEMAETQRAHSSLTERLNFNVSADSSGVWASRHEAARPRTGHGSAGRVAS